MTRPHRHPLPVPRPAAARGISLIELLLALAVLAIGVGLAAPSVESIAANQRLTAAVNTLVGSFQQARMRAVSRAGVAIACPSADGLACSGGLDWQHGWLVYDDGNGNRQLDPGEAIAARFDALPRGLVARSSVGRPQLRYRPDGSAEGSNLTLTVCDPQRPQRARAIVVNNGGRPRTGPGTCP